MYFPGIDIAFNVEPLGLLFAIIASGLWILTHIYGVGYMRGNNEQHHARFFACFLHCYFISNWNCFCIQYVSHYFCFMKF